jgi:mannobiose 2-epimerase
MNSFTSLLVLLILVSVCPAAAPTKDDYTRLADEIDSHLTRDVVRPWFPACLDAEAGGFHPNFSRDWTKGAPAPKFIVFQSRMTWITATLSKRRPHLRDELLPHARHGLRFLKDTMWDKQHGGFHWQLSPKGEVDDKIGTHKQLYGAAFGLYASAAAYDATQDPAALQLAKDAFAWLEKHAHDKQHGGYFEIFTREGNVIPADPNPTPRSRNFGGFLAGYKSMNSHIHILEALSQLYQVWKDPLVAQRLEETLLIVRDRIAVEPGCLNLYFTHDWKPVPDHDSFGHDVETAFLLLEAEETLGKHDPKTLRMARMLVDHALNWGWDDKHGGFHDRGFAFATAYAKEKIWWTQVEGLNALLLMHHHFGHETDRYWTAFLKQWQFIKSHQIDSEHRGLYPDLHEDGTPINTSKGHNWKAAYHDGRSFLHVSDRLRKLAQK